MNIGAGGVEGFCKVAPIAIVHQTAGVVRQGNRIMTSFDKSIGPVGPVGQVRPVGPVGQVGQVGTVGPVQPISSISQGD